MGVNDGQSPARNRMLHAAEQAHQDARRTAPGLRSVGSHRHWVEGNSRAPLGWEPWDYEQSRGYTGFMARQGEKAWFTDDEWDEDEVGIHPWDLTDEMEDWDTGPVRKHYSHPLDLDCHSRLPEIDPSMYEGVDLDPVARRFRDEHLKRVREAEKQAAQDEQFEYVKAQRRDQAALRSAAQKQIAAKAESGEEGKFMVRVRKGNRIYEVSYEVEYGLAYVTKRRYSWVPREDRR